jgi:uncharacterized membrane protein
MLHEWLAKLTEITVPLIDIIALIFITFGVLEACVKSIQSAWMPMNTPRFRLIWMRCARWLIAGLTFQLGADIIETSVAPTWDEIGQLGVIAVIRTFLNFFLERDQREMVELVDKSSEARLDKLSDGKS